MTPAAVFGRTRAFTFAAVAAVLAAHPAWAQGYGVESASGRLEARPTDAVRLDVDVARPEKLWAKFELPFAFPIYGVPYTSMAVSAHGCAVPGASAGFEKAGDPDAPHGQDVARGSFPYAGSGAASADGVLAPLWTACRSDPGDSGAGRSVFTWTSGTAPDRRFVVSWQFDEAGRHVTAQLQLHERSSRIVFAYGRPPVTGTSDRVARGGRCVVGFDERGGARFTAPPRDLTDPSGMPATDLVFAPRTVLFNDPAAARVGGDVLWRTVRRESLSADDSARRCSYLAKGQGVFHVPDRDVGKSPRAPAAAHRLQGLVDEDRATFSGGGGDALRWVRQVMDAKAVLLPRDGTPAVRVWFRVVEYFSVDDDGIAGPDDHVWNLRRMLPLAFPDDDQQSRIDHWVAWRGMASARLTVVKLFDPTQRNDSGRQFTTGRANEYALWCARFKVGPRGAVPDHDCPLSGWTRFALNDEGLGREAPQHADHADLREVVDPNYVDGRYAYVVRSEADGAGWICRSATPPAAMTDEAFEVDSESTGRDAR